MASKKDNQDNLLALKRQIMGHQIRRLLVMVLVLGIAALCLWQYLKNQAAKPYTIVKKEWIQARNRTEERTFAGFSDGVVAYSANGLSFFGHEGSELWQTAFSMKNPKVETRGDYLAVYDEGQKSVVLLKKDGYAVFFTTALSVSRLTLSENGVCAIVGEEKTGNDILFYDNTGRQMEIRIHTLMSESGYPIDIDFSPDGQMLAASYVYLESGVLQNQIVFYNFQDGKNEINRIVGAFRNYGDTLFTDVAFLNNERVCAVGDGRLVLYSLKNRTAPEELIVFAPTEQILRYAYNEGHLAYVTAGSGISNETTLFVKDLDGKELFTRQNDKAFDTLELGKGGVYLLGSSGLTILDYQGKERFIGTLEGDILLLVPGEKMNQMIVVSDREIYRCLLKKEKL